MIPSLEIPEKWRMCLLSMLVAPCDKGQNVNSSTWFVAAAADAAAGWRENGDRIRNINALFMPLDFDILGEKASVYFW